MFHCSVHTLFPIIFFISSHIIVTSAKNPNENLEPITTEQGERTGKEVSGDQNFTVGGGRHIPPKVYRELDPKLKYKPYLLPYYYNRRQIPSMTYLLAAISKVEFTPDLVRILKLEKYKVLVTLRIANVKDVDEANEEITFAADLFLQWQDQVIAHDSTTKYNASFDSFNPEETKLLFKTLDNEFLKEIWKPDIFIENLVKVQYPEVMTRPVTVQLNEITGDITYVARLRVKMECEMNLHYFPADTQSCEVILRSTSYSTDELVLEWVKPFGVFLEDCAGPNYDYHLTSVTQENKNEGFIGNSTRTFSTLRFTILARRKLSYHLVQTFLPSVFFIIISWLCFLVPSKMIEARIGILMTTLLTLTAMFASVRESTPTVSYVRAIDVWMIACIFLVFLTLMEFSVLLWARNTRRVKETTGDDLEGGIDEVVIKLNHEDTDEGESLQFKPLKPTIHRNPTARYTRSPQRRQDDVQQTNANGLSEFIEKYACLIFSIIFIVFCVVFWSCLLIGSGYFEWEVDSDINCNNQH